MGKNNKDLREAGSVNNAIANIIARGVEYGLKQVPAGIIRIINEGLWRKFMTPLGHLVEYKENEFLKFCEAKIPYGLGIDLKTLKSICQDNQEALRLIVICVEPLSDHGGDRKSAEKNQSDIGTLNKRGSNSQTYLIRRLKRDRPDIAERLAKGEFRSARAAAIEAGIIKPDTPFIVACKQLKKMNEDELLQIINKAQELMKGK